MACSLLPHFAAEEQYGKRTYNARSETVHKLPSFRPAWEAQQRCIIPSESVFEPNYESGKAVRWRIAQEGDVPFGIAGIYRRWRDPKGGPSKFRRTVPRLAFCYRLPYQKTRRCTQA